jgi:hypothetical protein
MADNKNQQPEINGSLEPPTQVLEVQPYENRTTEIREQVGTDLLQQVSQQMGGIVQVMQDNLKIDGEKKKAETRNLDAQTEGIIEDNTAKRIRNSEINRHNDQNKFVDIVVFIFSSIIALIVLVTIVVTLVNFGFTPETLTKLIPAGIILLFLVLMFAARSINWTENLAKIIESIRKEK